MTTEQTEIITGFNWSTVVEDEDGRLVKGPEGSYRFDPWNCIHTSEPVTIRIKAGQGENSLSVIDLMVGDVLYYRDQIRGQVTEAEVVKASKHEPTPLSPSVAVELHGVQLWIRQDCLDRSLGPLMPAADDDVNTLGLGESYAHLYPDCIMRYQQKIGEPSDLKVLSS